MRSSGLVSDDSADKLLVASRNYWNEHIHDLAIAKHPVGTPGFFQELDVYRFEKLYYLPQLIDFSAYRGKRLLEVGCGVGTDLVRFAQAGAIVTGLDLAEVAIRLARKNFRQRRLTADLRVMNGEALTLDDNTFDVVYVHGVLQYTADPQKMIGELHRVLRPRGEAILMVYNRYSWLNALSRLVQVELEHADSPILRTYSIAEFKRLLAPFAWVRIIPERFPVKTRLHHGWKAALYNRIFVGGFNWLPRVAVRPLGWHLLAFAYKG